ncbi:MAG TPA: Crp/Fnr family transcriptional regulator [Micropepsaceae bacterium]|nr:Crp/Fnr family transcriptional regulator [Micropepsaceae bacterium]
MYAWSGMESLSPPSPHDGFARGAGGGAPSQTRYAEVATPLRGLGTVVRLQRGAVIFRERDHANAIYRVVSGGVALSRNIGRRRRIVDFRFAGEFFGVVHRPEYTVTAEATSDCVLLSYPRGFVDTMFDELPQFRRALTGLLAERSQSGGDIVESHTARERIEAFLSSLSGRIGDWDAANLPVSREDIADRLDVSPAAVESVLRTLRSAGSSEGSAAAWENERSSGDGAECGIAIV